MPPVVAAPPTSDEHPPPVEPHPLQREQFDERGQPPPQRRWYGWQTLLVDVPSLSIWIVAAEVHPSSSALVGLGFAGFLFGAPIVHGAHGHWGKFGASIGMRAGTILLGVIGAAGCFESEAFEVASSRPCPTGYAALLVVGSLGILAAVAVDAAALAREDVPPEHRSSIGVAPWFLERGPGGGLRLAARSEMASESSRGRSRPIHWLTTWMLRAVIEGERLRPRAETEGAGVEVHVGNG